MSKEKICAVCHNPYSYCPVCNKDKDKPTWMFTFCSQNCHDIYEITSKFEDKRIKANEAKSKLDKLDLSRISNFGESYQTVISVINKNTKSTSVKVEKTDAEVAENKNNDEKIKNSPKKKCVKTDVE